MFRFMPNGWSHRYASSFGPPPLFGAMGLNSPLGSSGYSIELAWQTALAYLHSKMFNNKRLEFLQLALSRFRVMYVHFCVLPRLPYLV